MLKINLLPESARKPGVPAVDHFHRTPLFWLMLGGMGAFIVLLLIPLQLRQQQLQQLNAKIQALQPKKLELDELQRVIAQLRSQEQAFKSLGNVQGLWSKRLNTLADVTPDGVWFTELNFDETKGLVIQGQALVQGSDEMSHVGRLVADLKANGDFAGAVKDIQIESIKRVQDKEIELVQFTLTCMLSGKPNP